MAKNKKWNENKRTSVLEKIIAPKGSVVMLEYDARHRPRVNVHEGLI